MRALDLHRTASAVAHGVSDLFAVGLDAQAGQRLLQAKRLAWMQIALQEQQASHDLPHSGSDTRSRCPAEERSHPRSAPRLTALEAEPIGVGVVGGEDGATGDGAVGTGAAAFLIDSFHPTTVRR